MGEYVVHYATDAPYSDEYYAAECVGLTAATLQLLRRNHASLTALDVNFEERFASSTDWVDGAGIADCAHLRRLNITTHTDGYPWEEPTEGPPEEWRRTKGEELRPFCEEVARNTSIYHLEVGICGPDLPMQALAPFIRDNDNLRTLTITGRLFRGHCRNCCKIHDVASLAAALRERGNKKSVQRIGLNYTGIRYHVLEMELMTALSQYSGLLSLSLQGQTMNYAIRKCLKGLFQDPQCKLEELDLAACSINTGEACALSQVLLLNNTLKKLVLSNNPYIKGAGWEALRAVWTGPSCILEKLHIDDCVNDDECVVAIASGLAKNSSIKVLSLSFDEDCLISESVWQAFFHQLRDPLRLERLSVGGRDMCGKHGIAMVNMLARMNTLRVVDVSNTQIGLDGGQVVSNNLCNLLRSNGIQLTELYLHDNWIRGDAASALASALAEHTSLEVLDLGNSNMGDEWDETTIEGSSPEWKAFFESLSRHTSLVKLDLSCAGIDDASGTILAEALASSSKLKELHLQENNCSAAKFSVLLRNPDSSLRELDLSRTRIDDARVTAALADALVGNTSLGKLHLTTQIGMDAFAQLLGNKESLIDTFNSNHTLHEMGRGHADELVNLLSLNKMSNKNEVARQKILLIHFAGDDMDIQAFVGMKPTVLPQALAWAGRDDTGRSLLYQLIQGMPSLVECGNTRNDVVSGKRKRVQ